MAGSKPGERRGGRQKGTPNKLNRDLREAILQAFDKVGGVEYLVKLAKEEPRTFGALLSKLMPTQLTGANDGPIQTQAVADQALLAEMRELGERVRSLGGRPPLLPEAAAAEPPAEDQVTH